MGNCSLKGVRVIGNLDDSIRIMVDSGEIMELKAPKMVEDVLHSYPGYGVFRRGQLSSPLFHHEQLSCTQLYYLLPWKEAKHVSKITVTSEFDKDPATVTNEFDKEAVRPRRSSSLERKESVSQVSPLSSSCEFGIASVNQVSPRSSSVSKSDCLKNNRALSSGEKSDGIKNYEPMEPGLEALPSSGTGFWKVKIVIDKKQLQEILSEQRNGERERESACESNRGWSRVESAMFQPNPSQITPPTKALSFQESSVSKSLNRSEPSAVAGGGIQNGGLLKVESIMELAQKCNDDVEKFGMRIKHHEDNLKFLKTQMDNLDESILDMQVNLGKYYYSRLEVAKTENMNHSQTVDDTIDQIQRQEKSAASLYCQLKIRHGPMASQLPFTKDVIGIVATLGKVEDDNLSRLFSEYLGLETMTAIVCKTFDGIKALEAYDEKGSINKNIGLHGIGLSIGRHIDERFLAICLEGLRPYAGEFIADDPQRKLDLLKPRLPNGKSPPGFLGFAVNMINLDRGNLSCLTVSGHGLRETLFYSLFSRMQVYRTKKEMLLSLPCVSDGAISLDGGMIKTSGVFALGNRREMEVRFPISTEELDLPIDYLEAERKIKIMKWEKERIDEDIKREQALLEHANENFASKKQEYFKFSSVYSNQLQAQSGGYRPIPR
ncbi:Defective in meristem silencing [Thalictrum thalictroides]|uniref:Defective in meristem silencing n=1 Tax=Thalictrum thalictroides TaxID=46969 RepID=A0A7J6VUU1_THATH|nr:Defective in meristem silencing [Thalictrum thalictroides]